LSFFSEEYRSVLNLCGKRSGRDTDKASEAGITPFSPASGIVSFKEARLIIKCKKLFKTHLKSEDFIDKSIVSKWYSENDLHYMFVAEIENIWAK
ncbi:MAG: flavin reductase family protein, partial [Bacteroidales bacterium]